MSDELKLSVDELHDLLIQLVRTPAQQRNRDRRQLSAHCKGMRACELCGRALRRPGDPQPETELGDTHRGATGTPVRDPMDGTVHGWLGPTCVLAIRELMDAEED